MFDAYIFKFHYGYNFLNLLDRNLNKYGCIIQDPYLSTKKGSKRRLYVLTVH